MLDTRLALAIPIRTMIADSSYEHHAERPIAGHAVAHFASNIDTAQEALVLEVNMANQDGLEAAPEPRVIIERLPAQAKLSLAVTTCDDAEGFVNVLVRYPGHVDGIWQVALEGAISSTARTWTNNTGQIVEVLAGAARNGRAMTMTTLTAPAGFVACGFGRREAGGGHGETPYLAALVVITELRP